jgi:hypothetical protein
MTNVAQRLAVVVAGFLAAAAAALPSYAASPATWTAAASFDRVNPYDPSGCIHLKLDLQVTATTAYVDYWARNTCFGFDYDHLTGSSTLTAGQLSLGSFESASVSNVGVSVFGAGYFQSFTFNLTWTGTGSASMSHPSHGSGQVARSVSATVTGSIVDLVGNNAFSGSDASTAEITQVIHTVG